MSKTLKTGLSGLLFDIQQTKAVDYCTSTYGPEWTLDTKEFKILDVPYYIGRCVHKSHSGTDNYCCDNFLTGTNVFGSDGAIGNFKTTCDPATKNIVTCNRINKKTNIARMLAELALKKGSTDNITVIVVFF